MDISQARYAAYTLVSKFLKNSFRLDDSIFSIVKNFNLNNLDKGLCSHIVYGVVRHKTLLENIIEQASGRKLKDIQTDIQAVLLCAFYQLLFLDKVPTYAIVNDSVNIIKKLSNQKAGNFVNAILRRNSSVDAIKKFEDKIEKEKDPEIKYSHPRWIIDEIKVSFPNVDIREFLRFDNNAAPLDIRVNPTRISRDELLCEILLEHKEATISKMNFSPLGLRILSHIVPAELNSLRDGICAVQDEASQMIAYLVNLQKDETFLDYCSAPGGKVAHIANLNPDNDKIIASDISEERLVFLRENLNRLGCKNVTVLSQEVILKKFKDGELPLFDKILVDAPCSSLGTLRRHPEVRWKTSPAFIKKINENQKEILRQSSKMLQKGGSLFYSTCSFAKSENEMIIEDFLENEKEFHLVDYDESIKEFFNTRVSEVYGIEKNSADVFCAYSFFNRKVFRTIPPTHQMDGFFCAKLKKE